MADIYSEDDYTDSTSLSKLFPKHYESHPEHEDIIISKSTLRGNYQTHPDYDDITMYDSKGLDGNNNIVSGTMNVKEPKVNSVISNAESDLAHQVISARIANEQGLESAQRYITDTFQGKKTIIASTNYSVAVLDKQTGKVTIASRGMNPIQNPGDIHNIFNQTFGDNDSLHSTRQLVREIKAKGYIISDVANHSMTGADSITMAFDKGHENIQHTLFDPQITVKNVLEHSSNPTLRNPIKILRNTETFISTPGLALNNMNPLATNIFETHVLKTKLNGTIESHKMINFTKDQHDAFDRAQIDLMKITNEHVHHEQMADMKQQFVDTGKTFTEYLKDFNSHNGVHTDNVDVTTDGILGDRINNNSGIVKMWKQLGGNLSDYEREHINSILIRADGDLPLTKEVVDLIKKGQYEKAKTVSKQRMEKAVTAIDATEIGSHPFVKGLQGALGLSAMFNGGATALLTSIIDSQRPHLKNKIADSFVSGGEAGLISGAFSAGVEGIGIGMAGVTLLPAIIGGAVASSVATVTAKGVRKLVKNKNSDTREAVPDVVSGAVAGGVAVAVSDAVILSAGALGVEIGSVGGLPGILVGGTLGAFFGAMFYTSHKIAKINGVPSFSKKVSSGFGEIKQIQVNRANAVKHTVVNGANAFKHEANKDARSFRKFFGF